MFGHWHEFEENVGELQGLLRGSLRIAGVTTTEYFLAQWLKPFVTAYPGIEVDLVVENRDTVVRRLERAEDDMAIMMMPPAHIPLQHMVVMDNPLVLVGPAGHVWKAKMPVKHLAGVDLLMREKGSGTRQATLEFLASHNITPNIRMTLGSNEAIKHAVAAGLGLAVLSRLALAQDPESEGLCVLPVASMPIRRSWQVVWRQDRHLTRAATAFMEFIRQEPAPATNA
jgi:DNA-binding transcriptional LysR family regulator